MYVVAGITITFVLAARECAESMPPCSADVRSAVTIVIRRFIKRSAWLVQFFPTSAGTYIIPNAVMSLCSCIFIYTAVYSAYVFVIVQVSSAERRRLRRSSHRRRTALPIRRLPEALLPVATASLVAAVAGRLALCLGYAECRE